ncbi:septum formation initiator family protein [Persephonella sp.]|uniref:septum formation initiator family protein n=1 Tax=Persephonella sp. TaxID=2060922 RepID=UPI00261DCF6F|nr:septum formation initiator family protein [Persephonella sp.]
MRELVIELKKDLSYVKKYTYFWGFILLIAGAMVLYNQYYFSIDKQIVELTKMKNQLAADKLMLQKTISKLSSPERISKIAKQKLKMDTVDYSKVHFIDTK